MFAFNFDELPESTGSAVRVFAVSDVHADMKGNLDVLRGWPRRPDDVLLLAGDVSHDLAVLRATFEVLRARFGHVFYCPGNHDLWLHSEDGCQDSIEKLRKIELLAEELDIQMRPGLVDGVTIVPLHSWYHASFDADPDVVDSSLAPPEMMMMDFHQCKWPAGLVPHGGSDSIALFMDALNDVHPIPVSGDGRRGPTISFSHFLPRRELLPEKRLLFYPPLPKVAGSLVLGERVRRLAPDVHVFGHSHYAWDVGLDGVRYIQACLAYPRERAERFFSLSLTNESGSDMPPPLLVYDHNRRDFPLYKGFWSEYYKVHRRTPEDVSWIYQNDRARATVLQAVKRAVAEGTGPVTDATIRAFL